MMGENKPEYSLIKLVVCMQATLELFDELKGTSAYKHNLKQLINRTNKEIERELNKIYPYIDDSQKEETFMSIERAVSEIYNTPIEKLFEQGYKPLGKDE